MKTIGIDARLYFQTGVGVYIRNYLHFLEKHAPDNIRFYIYLLEKDSSQIHFSNAHFIKKEVNTKWHSIAEQTEFYRILMADNLDLMHFTYFSYPVLYKRKFIATIHDVTPLIHKTGKASSMPSFMYEMKYRAFRYVLSQQVKNALKIITPTNAVKDQLIEIYGNQYAKKIVTIYEGVNYEFFNAQENKGISKFLPKNYFLYVGNFYPHKNVESLIEVFSVLDKKNHLILSGPDNFFSGKIEKQLRDKAITNITFYHPSSIEDLVYLYKNAEALINPSRSEGFGLPLIEASYFNTPVIASDLPVFRELLNKNFIPFNPLDVSDMKHVIQKFIDHKPTIQADIKRFSFEKMVKEYIELFQDLKF